jgi:hypothetical protein
MSWSVRFAAQWTTVGLTHEIVERIEAPRKLTKDEFKQYIRDEVLPLEEEKEAEA